MLEKQIITVADLRDALKKFNDDERIVVSAYYQGSSADDLIIDRIQYIQRPDICGNVIIHVSEEN